MYLKSKVYILCFLTLSIFSLPMSAQAVQMWGFMVDPDPNVLVTFDSATPETFNSVGSSGVIPFATGLDFDSGGNLFMTTIEATNFLYSVNRSTGISTLIGGSGLAADYSTSDLSWDPVNNRMIALASSGSVGSSPILYDVNLGTGALTSIGTIAGITDGFEVSLAVDANGDIFVHGLSSDRWYKVDPGTLAATALNVLPFNTNGGQGGVIDWGGDGTLYHAALTSSFGGQLYTINKANGDPTLVGSLGTNIPAPFFVQITDVAIAPSVAIPEPSTMLLLGGGLLGMIFFRRKLRK